ncbi:FlgN family protein [Desulfofarcimen acetoxidans DSM 771]|uniref:FlgN family protein n=1 Tax=Desulfofarcimen acetoxidans (strain ATCC 49208 / DSM 771 / KCTC 5769 / VKM B-1644 / 5575) TaxID=485916 RepID=C8W1E3_DESAS|nr:flagellar export chaperone FlgN [Desulfofarcimen acetoxidans]ACV61588.1 FlgN family protein [Desulfofarcimen acetoxidans DSM 771]
MQNLFQQLRDCLNIQKNIAIKLFKASQQHLEALKRNNHTDIKATAGRQEILTGELVKIQNTCSGLQDEIKNELGLPAGTALSALSESAPGFLSHELLTLIQELRNLFVKIQDINEINNILTQNALSFNERLINILLPKQRLTYKENGVIDEKQPGISRLNLTV